MKTKMLVLKNGERFPILLGDDGIPLFYPTVYEAVMRRQINLASATLSADLCAIKFLYSWAKHRHIDLEERFHKAQFLTLKEIDDLADAFKSRVDYFFDDIPFFNPDGNANPRKPLKVKCLEAFRVRELSRPADTVSSDTAARRLYVAAAYLDWLAQTRTTWISQQSQLYENTHIARTQMKGNLEARIPEISRNETDPRQGITQEVQDLLLAVIDPASSENPWKDKFTRIRNQLFIHLLLELGPRRGELLLLRIGRDINIGSNILTIRRVPDDKDDPRADEPNAKTLEREIPLSDKLARMVFDYINSVRNTLKGARSHDFLFVAAKSGKPLSKSAASKIFRVLRSKVPGLPENLTPHVLRHTWNDNFSKECEDSGVPEETEKKTRNYLAGWKKGSRTAEVYTRRFVKRKAQEVSLKLQEKIAKGRKTDGEKK